MKMRARQGIGRKESSDAISLEQEDLLWGKGILGESTPDQLRETVLFLLGVNLALRGVMNISDFAVWGLTHKSQFTVTTVGHGIYIFKKI